MNSKKLKKKQIAAQVAHAITKRRAQTAEDGVWVFFSHREFAKYQRDREAITVICRIFDGVFDTPKQAE